MTNSSSAQKAAPDLQYSTSHYLRTLSYYAPQGIFVNFIYCGSLGSSNLFLPSHSMNSQCCIVSPHISQQHPSRRPGGGKDQIQAATPPPPGPAALTWLDKLELQYGAPNRWRRQVELQCKHRTLYPAQPNLNRSFNLSRIHINVECDPAVWVLLLWEMHAPCPIKIVEKKILE